MAALRSEGQTQAELAPTLHHRVGHHGIDTEARSLELLERSGCSAGLLAAGYPVNSVHISAGSKQIAQVSLEGLESKYPFGLMIPQSETERVLEQFLNTLGVSVERQVELIDFAEGADTVTCRLRRGDGTEESVETQWLIGCDGAHSTVRHQLGMEFYGDTSLIDWILADVHLENVTRAPHIDIVWHADGVLAIFPIEETRYRIIADAGTAPENNGRAPDPTLADVQAVLDKRFPGGARATDPVWLSSFRINERKVAKYRAGRAFLGGDAAHVHSPAGGRGMNTGMQDACNLAWKLALVVRGVCGESLLDSYSQERSPIADALLKVTGRVTSLSTLTGGIGQALRNHTAALLLGLTPVQRFAAETVSELSIGYAHSSLNMQLRHGSPKAGERAPIRTDERPVGAGDRPRFALFAAAEGMPADFLVRYESVLEPGLRDPFDSGGMWLVRPDGYVGLAADAGEWHVAGAYLDHLQK